MDLQDFLTPEMVSILVSAILAILSALAAYGTRLFKIYLQSKMSTSHWDFLAQG